jgi:hypothetical protein
VASTAELAALDDRIEELRQEVLTRRQRVEELRQKKNRLDGIKPIPDLIAHRDVLIAALQAEEVRKNELVELAQGITPEDAQKFELLFRKRCEQWRLRRSKCLEIIDTLCEAADKKPAQMKEELDLETDEALGLKLEFRNKQYTVIEGVSK